VFYLPEAAYRGIKRHARVGTKGGLLILGEGRNLAASIYIGSSWEGTAPSSNTTAWKMEFPKDRN